jgi:hypothetical protein
MTYKFQVNQTVKYKEDRRLFKIARRYKTESGNKYDLIAFNAKYRLDGVLEEFLERVKV